MQQALTRGWAAWGGAARLAAGSLGRTRVRPPVGVRPVAAMPAAAAPAAAQGVFETFTLAVTGAAEFTDLKANDWLSAAPRGAYTTARTVDQTSVFELDFHVKRLASSVSMMMEDDAQVGPGPLFHVRRGCPPPPRD